MKEGFRRFENKEELKICIDQGFDVNAFSKSLEDSTPLVWASSCGFVDCVKILLELKADPNLYDTKRSRSALHTCIRLKTNNIEIAKLLINYGANVNSKTNLGTSILHTACFWNDIDIVKLLINARADLEIRDANKQTALDTSINRIFTTSNGIITLLLNNGAKLPSGKHKFSKEVSLTIRKLRCIKRVLITFCALSKKTGAIHKDLRNPIAKMVWETREDDAWDQKEFLKKKGFFFFIRAPSLLDASE